MKENSFGEAVVSESAVVRVLTVVSSSIKLPVILTKLQFIQITYVIVYINYHRYSGLVGQILLNILSSVLSGHKYFLTVFGIEFQVNDGIGPPSSAFRVYSVKANEISKLTQLLQ